MRDVRYDILFEPVRIGPVTARNRFYAAPHATGHSPLQPNGSIAIRETKAEGGWAVVATQLSEIDPSSSLSNLPVDTFWDDQDARLQSRLVERIHAHQALAAIELGHSGLRSRNLSTGFPVFAPSGLPILKPDVPVQSKTMDLADIRAFRKSHRDAALRARGAGFDIIYVYASHDASLLTNFLSRRTNFRTDDYGGSLENRSRLLREIIEDTKEAVGDKCAIAVRLAVHEFNPDHPLTKTNEGHDLISMLAELPDLWDVNVSGWSRDSSSSRFELEGFQEEYTGWVKSLTSKPVVGVGRYTSPDHMARLIKKGVFDMIGAARPAIADPFLPRKIEEGRVEDIRECIGCNMCVATDAYSVPIKCTQNPTMSEEWRRGWHPENVPAAPASETILIVGAGPTGLEAALVLAKAGHKILIADRRNEMGGRVLDEARLAGLSSWLRVRDYRAHQLTQMANVEIFLGSDMQAQDIAEVGADRVIIATGAQWRRDGVGSTSFAPIPGLPSCAVFTPQDVYSGHDLPHDLLIYDDEHNYLGGVLAEHLARAGHSVTLVTPLPVISSWTVYTLEQPRIVSRLHELGVVMRPRERITEVSDGVVQLIAADTLASTGDLRPDGILLVTARHADDALYQQLVEAGSLPTQLYPAGDCVAPGTIQAATFAGHQIARHICGDPLAKGLYRREAPLLLAELS